MNIDAYLKRSGWTEEQLGAMCKPPVRQHTINRLRNRKRCASLELALAIERATGGQISASDLPLSRRTRQALTRLRAGTATATAAESAA